MNIVMATNTYLPHVGGVARSVEAFTTEYRRRGHRVLVVAPEFPHMPPRERDVVRIPAIQNFNGSDFSVVLPVPGRLREALDRFAPEIVHAHHPYLLGMTALRIARYRNLPLVFTHHTRYEEYTHYVPLNSPALKRFVIELATRYANLCAQVFAPSRSIAELLKTRGVTTPVAVVPTGVEIGRFARGDGPRLRAALGIPRDALVVGHVGRLAPEKNLHFLAEAVAAFLKTEPRARFLVVGKGPSEADIRSVFAEAGLAARLHSAGILQTPRLADAYHAMDLFAFASKSETQGMVLTEAMAAGLAVVALDAPGVRDVVQDRHNGRLLDTETVTAFVQALAWVASRSPVQRQALRSAALATAQSFSLERTADLALGRYQALRSRTRGAKAEADAEWERVLNLVKAQWEITKGLAEAAGVALGVAEPPEPEGPKP